MFNNQIIAGSSGQGGGSFYSETIDNSVRIVGNSTGSNAGRFTRTFSTVDSATDFTLNFWVKRNEQDNPVNSSYGQNIFNFRSGTSGSVLNDIAFAGNTYTAGDQILITDTNSANPILATSNLLRDFGAWYNIHIMADMNNATASERLKIFINGTEASYAVDNRSSYSTFAGLAAGAWTIGDYYGYNYSIGSTIARWAFVDNSTLAASYFGEFSNGIWVPKALTGITWGSAGHLLDFAGTGTSQDSSGIGADTSGQNNHWAVSNIAASDVVPDSPTNNFGTMNPLDKNSMTVSEGSLKVVPSADYKAIRGTFGIPTSGKWYFEARILTPGGGNVQDNQIGVVTQQNVLTGTSPYPQSFTYGVGYFGSGKINRAGSTAQSSLTAFTAGKILGVAVNVDDDEVQFYLDGSAVGTTHALVSTTEPNFAFYVGATNRGAVFNFGQDSTFAGAISAGGNADANGIGDFAYAPPANHLALCTSNLDEPTIGPNSDKQATDHFETKLWSSDVVNPAAGDKQISLDFQPDFVWSKDRSAGESNYVVDSVRGDNDGNKLLMTDRTNAEGGDAIGSTTAKYDFTTSGFDIIDTNSASGEVYYNNGSASTPRTYVGWCWKAGGTAVSNSDGSLTCNVSANTDAGFSIVTWTANSDNGTLGHGLNSAPELIIAKPLGSGTNWYVMHTPGGVVPANNVLNLDSTAAKFNPGVNHFNDTYPTSTVFSYGGYLGDDLSNDDKVAYCFHSVSGYSAVGSFVGNGSADGPFVYTGFRPAWVMTKRIDAAADWHIVDVKRETYNVMDSFLFPNGTYVETSDAAYSRDLLSNGFKIRSSTSYVNASGGTFIYLAFAEAPFKYANAR